MTQKSILLIITLTLLVTFAFTQTPSLIIPKNINLPRDTFFREQLISSINNFLSLKDKPNNENTFVLQEDLLETSLLLDEMKEIEKSRKMKDDNFYKGYLTNVMPLKDSNYLIQFTYVGVNRDTPVIRASFSIIAKKLNKHFFFSSPLKQNTINWKHHKIDNSTVYFKNKINTAKEKLYFKMIGAYDKKLGVENFQTEFYSCDNLNECLRLIGVDYKSEYNGNSFSSLSAIENKVNLVVNGTLTSDFTAFDPHDLWHSRLHKVISTNIINKPVDEGTAYLYGGSWGQSWKEILRKFKNYATSNPNADWLTLYNEEKNFDDKQKYPLNGDYVINALIIQKIENEKGFAIVKELLSCGKYQKNNENYFLALEKITGITKANFNSKVWMLINNEF